MHNMSNAAPGPSASEPKRNRFLDAAQAVFARYGYRRASMADIAAEAGVSRPALYLVFRSKPDVLRSLADRLRHAAITRATDAWRDGPSFAENLEQTILGKEADIFPLLHASPHGAEILAADAALTAEISDDLDRSFRALLAARTRDAAASGAIDLACVDGDADALAGVVAAAAKALVNAAADEAEFRLSVRRLARMTAASVRPA